MSYSKITSAKYVHADDDINVAMENYFCDSYHREHDPVGQADINQSGR
jgi:hypothetical protein